MLFRSMQPDQRRRARRGARAPGDLHARFHLRNEEPCRICQILGKRRTARHCWLIMLQPGGPYRRLIFGPKAHFSIAQYDAAHDGVALATVGMSLVAEPDPIEIHVFARRDPLLFSSLVELLTIVAHFHRTGARLGLHHTVNFGRPWLPASSCTYGFVSLPYLDGQNLERSTAVSARCLWLIPITEAELALKRTDGVEALENAFERAEFNYLDPTRRSAV